MKQLFIDGNNMAYRTFWTHRHLSNSKGVPVSLLFGFFKSLTLIKQAHSDYKIVVVWDSKSARRIAESTLGVERGLIPSPYKATRSDHSSPDDNFKSMFEQMDTLKDGLNLTSIQQVHVPGYEADDVIYSYCKGANAQTEIKVVTSDKDYYQLLQDNVKIFDSNKKVEWTKQIFEATYNITPSLWVDVGAISGDAGDNIHGADGWGEKTALKYVQQYGTLEQVLLAIEQKTEKSKKEHALLSFKERLILAKSLKQMDVVQELPSLSQDTRTLDRKALQGFFIKNGFASLLTSVVSLCS